MNDCRSVMYNFKLDLNAIQKAIPISTSAGSHETLSLIRWEAPLVDSSFAKVTSELWPDVETDDYLSTASLRMAFRNVYGPSNKIASKFVERHMIHSLESGLTERANVTIRMFWPPSFHKPAYGDLAMYLPWEFGVIPMQWMKPLMQNVRVIYTPSSESKNA